MAKSEWDYRTAKYTQNFAWKLYVFEVTRKQVKNTIKQPKPRRVVVYAPTKEGAVLGVGNGRDEVCRQVSARPWEGIGASKTPSRQDLADFFEALGSMLKAGASITSALAQAARQTESIRLRGVIGTVAHIVSTGVAFHIAMACFPKVFSPMQIALVQAAGETGLDQTGHLLNRLAGSLARGAKSWRKLIGTLIYPLTLIVMSMVGAMVLEMKALPSIVEMAKGMGGRLPWITLYFYEASKFITEWAWLLIPGILGSAVFAIVGLPSLLKVKLVQRIVMKIWLIGTTMQELALSQSLITFSLLNESGARPQETFDLAAKTSGNVVIEEFYQACYNRITYGESIEESFYAERHLLGKVGTRLAGKIETGLDGGNLPRLLEGLASELQDKAETRIAIMPRLFEMPILGVCGCMIGCIVLAMFLPYPTLLADVVQQQVANHTSQVQKADNN